MPPRARARWLLITVRLSQSSLTGTERTLVAVGQDDYEDFHVIARRLHEEIQDAQLAVVKGAGHLPSLERPDQKAALARSFLNRR